ncbi:MAG: dicarboxylate/amino acid:cation symporter [Muribaculaceae bacterium]|nr:dicarboxylate/amino acid:cation symporter [Muribaculaceae bacterium]
MSIKKLGLLPQIIIAILLGIGAGFVLPQWAIRIFVTFNTIFSEYLGFIIPLLIVGFVAPAIAEVGDKAGKMLLVTAALAYAFTLMSGLLAYFTGITLFPSMIKADAYMAAAGDTTDIAPFFTMSIEPMMDVLSALVLAFILGLGTAQVKSASLRNGLAGFRDVITWVIMKSIVPLLPLYIFGIFMDMTISGKVGPMLLTFAKIIGVIFVLHVFVLVLQYCIAGAVARRNPFKALWGMMPAYFTALGTASSAATIPVTLRQAIAIGVDKDVAGFTIPLCATIHMSGSTLKIVACALALMISQGMHYDFGMFAGFIAMLGVSIIAAPGVPGGAIMASLGVLSSMLGFTQEQNALIIALYIAMDSFGTACNVTGDGSIAIIVDRIFARKPSTSVNITDFHSNTPKKQLGDK